jgi:type VI protein secretion system component VasK
MSEHITPDECRDSAASRNANCMADKLRRAAATIEKLELQWDEATKLGASAMAEVTTLRRQLAEARLAATQVCRACNGSGLRVQFVAGPTSPCGECGGTGKVTARPPASADTDRLRLVAGGLRADKCDVTAELVDAAADALDAAREELNDALALAEVRGERIIEAKDALDAARQREAAAVAECARLRAAASEVIKAEEGRSCLGQDRAMGALREAVKGQGNE